MVPVPPYLLNIVKDLEVYFEHILGEIQSVVILRGSIMRKDNANNVVSWLKKPFLISRFVAFIGLNCFGATLHLLLLF